MTKPLSIFYSYAASDKDLRDKLEEHLTLLKRQGLITSWHDRLISGGQEWNNEISAHLDTADIILLLISAAFLASNYCYGVEMTRALEKHKERSARVIPIVLRRVDWHEAPFSHLQALPTKGKPIVSGQWHDEDEAFADVAENIRKVVKELCIQREGGESLRELEENTNPVPPSVSPAESSGLSVLAQLEQLIQDFKALRSQISDWAHLKGSKGFTAESCENQYNRLYADTMIFLTTHLPASVSGGADGFVAIVQGKSALELQQRNNLSVSLARRALTALAKFEKLAAQIDACTATLEMYKQKHFSASGGSTHTISTYSSDGQSEGELT